MIKKVIYTLTPKQSAAFRLLTNDEDVDLNFGGAKGPGKSFLFCVWVDHWCGKLIEIFGLKNHKPAEPIPVGFIGRKRSVDFSHTTLETFKRVIPADHYTIKQQEKAIIFDDTLKVFFGGLDNTDQIRKFNSMEIAFFGIDQAEETDRPDLDVLQAAVRLTVNGIKPPYKRLYTCNPADCWLKEDFIDKQLPRHFFIPALPSDNPHLPNNYEDTLRNAFRYNTPLLRAYLFGDWHALKAENALISSEMLQELKDVKIWSQDIRRVVSCDPALGGDECVVECLENTKLIDRMILHDRDSMKIAGHMIVMAEKNECDNYAADTTGGLGHAILDRIREMKQEANIQYADSSLGAEDSEKFYNLKAEMWWYAMTEIADKKVAYPEDEETRAQLCAMRFKVINSNGKIQMEAKDQTKKRIGRSPDRADCRVIGIWATQRARPFIKKDRWADDFNTGEVIADVSGGAMAA